MSGGVCVGCRGKFGPQGKKNSSAFTVVVNKDGDDVPWGFRLRGGRDVEGGTPLLITRVS